MANNYFGIQWPSLPQGSQQPQDADYFGTKQQRPQTPVPPAYSGYFPPRQSTPAPVVRQPVTQPQRTYTPAPTYQQDRWEAAPREPQYEQDRYESAPRVAFVPYEQDRWEAAPTPPAPLTSGGQRPYLPMMTQDGTRREQMPELVASVPPVSTLPAAQAIPRIAGALPGLLAESGVDDWGEFFRRVGPDLPGEMLRTTGQVAQENLVQPVVQRAQDLWQQFRSGIEQSLANAPAMPQLLPSAQTPEQARQQASQNIQRAANFVGQTVLPAAGRALQVPYETVGEPFVAAMWTTNNSPEYIRLRDRQRLLDAQAAEARRAGQWDRYNALQAQSTGIGQQMQRLAAATAPRNPNRDLTDRPTIPQVIQDIYGTGRTANVERYRREADPGAQLLAAALFDPLNAADLIGAGVANDVRKIRAYARWKPVAKSVEQVATDMTQTAARSNSFLGRLNPVRLTPESLRTSMANRATDVTTRIVEATQVDPDIFVKWVQNPDAPDVVKATGGISASLPSKQTVALIREALGDDPVVEIGKLLSTHATDPAAAVAELADNYAKALVKLFPEGNKNLLTRARDWNRQLAATMFMGYNPGYMTGNFASNTVTALFDGVSPFASKDYVTTFEQRWGVMPVETRQGIGAAGDAVQPQTAKGGKPTAKRSSQAQAVLGEPLGARDVGRGVTRKAPTVTMSQNIESIQSQAIVVNTMADVGPQLWGRDVARLQPKLKALGFTDTQARELSNRIAHAMNPQELFDVARKAPTTAAPIPPGATATGTPPVAPAPTSPGPTVAPSGVVPPAAPSAAPAPLRAGPGNYNVNTLTNLAQRAGWNVRMSPVVKGVRQLDVPGFGWVDLEALNVEQRKGLAQTLRGVASRNAQAPTPVRQAMTGTEPPAPAPVKPKPQAQDIVREMPPAVDVGALTDEERAALIDVMTGGRGAPVEMFGPSVPPETLRQLHETTNDPALVRAVQDAVEQAQTPQQAEAAVTVLEQTATDGYEAQQVAGEVVRVLAESDAGVYPADLLRRLQQLATDFATSQAERAAAVTAAAQEAAPVQAPALQVQYEQVAAKNAARVRARLDDAREGIWPRLQPTANQSRYELYSDVANGKVDYATEAAFKLGYSTQGSFYPFVDPVTGKEAPSHVANAWRKYVGKDIPAPRNNVEFAKLADENPDAMDRWVRYLGDAAEKKGITLEPVETYIERAPSRHATNIRIYEPPDDVARAEAAGIIPAEPLDAGRVMAGETLDTPEGYTQTGPQTLVPTQSLAPDDAPASRQLAPQRQATRGPSYKIGSGSWTDGQPVFGTAGYREPNPQAAQAYHRTGGWKLHLTADAENYAAIDRWLWKNHDQQYKLLSGGDVGEKDFTVYVGSRDAAEALAARIERELGDKLLPAGAGEADALIGSTGQVAARFDVQQHGPFNQYGRAGMPYDKDASEIYFSLNTSRGILSGRIHATLGTALTPDELANLESVMQLQEQRIHQALIQQYGDFYTGSGANKYDPTTAIVSPSPSGADLRAHEARAKAFKARPVMAQPEVPAYTVDDFARRLMAGEKLDTPDAVQFYQNNADAIEQRLRAAMPQQQPVTPAPTTPTVPTPPDPRQPWQSPAIIGERERRGTRLPVPGQPSVTPDVRERLLDLARQDRDRSNMLLSGGSPNRLPSNADPIDGEILRIRANAYGRLAQGEPKAQVINDAITEARRAAQDYNAQQERIWGATTRKTANVSPQGFMSESEAETRIRHAGTLYDQITAQPAPVPGQPRTRVPFGAEPPSGAQPSQMTWPEYQRYRISLLTPEQQAKWAQRDVNGIAFAARENVLQQWGDDWQRLTQTPIPGPTRTTYETPGIVGDYEAATLPPGVFEEWADSALGAYPRAPYQSPATTLERPLQPDDWQRYGVPERMSIAPRAPEVTPPQVAPSAVSPGGRTLGPQTEIGTLKQGDTFTRTLPEQEAYAMGGLTHLDYKVVKQGPRSVEAVILYVDGSTGPRTIKIPKTETVYSHAPAPQVAPSAAKQPWQMTKVEWEQQHDAESLAAVRAEKQRAAAYAAQIGQPAEVVQRSGLRKLLELSPFPNDYSGEWRMMVGSALDSMDDTELARLLTIQKAQDPYIERQASGMHRQEVTKAIKAGQPVPASVLADYPDLRPAGGAVPSPAAAEPRPREGVTGAASKVPDTIREELTFVEQQLETIRTQRQAADTKLARTTNNMARESLTKQLRKLDERIKTYEQQRASLLAEQQSWQTPAPAQTPAKAVPTPARQLTGPTGNTVTAYGTDPNRVYEFRYRVAELDDLIASQSDAMTPNPAYPAELQPRIRDRAASQAQVTNMAQNLQPDGLLGNFNSLDRGAMIVGPDAVVESGNGRVLALRQVRAAVPEKWQAYQARLREVAAEYGIDPAQLDNIKNPVLVRERVSDVDRVRFTAEANEQATLAMSPVETALQDAGRVQDDLLATLQVGDNQSVDQALTSAQNWPIIKAFLAAIPANERAALATAEGGLNAFGLARLKGALFAKTYPGDAGQRLAQTFIESLDPGIKNIEAGMFASLPRMSRAESLVRSGERAAELAFGDDLAAAVDVLSRLKEQGLRVDDYLAQLSMFDDELTPFQKEVLQYLDSISRSPKKVRESLNAYADAVEAAPRPGQMGLLADPTGITKEDILGRIRQTQANAPTEQAGLWGTERIGQANPNPPAFGAQSTRLEKPTFGQRPLGITGPGTQHFQGAMQNIADAFNGVRTALRGAPPMTPISPQQQRDLLKLLYDEYAPAMIRDKAITADLGTTVRNFVLGDYAHKRNALEWASYIFPFPTWYSFTYWNWLQRLATHPAAIANYARYQQAVNDANTRWYREMVGDPTAELPEQYKGKLRIGSATNPYFLNLEARLMPLNALVEDFAPKAAKQAPLPGAENIPADERQWWQTGELLQKLGGYGPSLYTGYLAAYAAWLKLNGYEEAAGEWLGYLTSLSKPLKAASALWKQAGLPGASAIPAGGLNPQAALTPNALDTVAGGDIWERRRIPKFFADLYASGEYSLTDLQDAAYNQSGPIWERMMQAEAVDSAGRSLWGFAGFNVNNFTPLDADVERMWHAYFALQEQKDTLSPADYKRQRLAFDEQYPWARSFMLARNQDPQDRFNDYAGAVLDRLPPAGPERTNALTAAGLTQDLLDKYYAGKYSTATMTPAEAAAFQQGIMTLANATPVPDAQRQRAYTTAQAENLDINATAAALVGLTAAQIAAHWDAYYADDDKARRKAYLAANPAFARYLDERGKLRDQGSATFNAYYGSTGTGTGSTGGASLYQQGRTEAAQQYGEAAVGEAEAYNRMSPTQRAAFRQQNPEAYARIKQVNNAIFKYTNPQSGSSYSGSPGYSGYSGGYSGGRSYSGGGGRSYGGYSGAPTPPAMPAPTTPTAPPPAEWQGWTEQDFTQRWQPMVDADPQLPQLVGVLFGKSMLDVLRLWLRMSPEQRALWLQSNPQMWAMVQRFMRWFMGQQAGQTNAGLVLGSIPPNAPLPAGGTVPPNAPYVPPAPAGVPLPPG